MTDVINNKIFFSNLKILYWKYLREHVFLHGHDGYEKIRYINEILIGRDYGPLTGKNFNKEI